MQAVCVYQNITQDNYMNLDELLDKQEEEILDEAKHTRSDEYDRYWHKFTPEEKEQYIKEGHKPKSGIWIYRHREAMGLDYHNKDVIVHHKDHDKHNYKKSNLKILSRADHVREDPNARKHWKCSVPGCGNEHYARGYCLKHYIAHFRKGDFGNYNPKKNRSKKDRKKED